VQCPYCSADSQVVDSRATAESVRRRRVCNGCKRRFTTYERVSSPALKVAKRDGKIEPFDLEKLRDALARVSRGRPITTGDVTRAARQIEAQLVDSGTRSIRSSQIAELALVRLADMDRLAYNRLAANYFDENGHLRLEPRTDTETEPPTQLNLFADPAGTGRA